MISKLIKQALLMKVNLELLRYWCCTV